MEDATCTDGLMSVKDENEDEGDDGEDYVGSDKPTL